MTDTNSFKGRRRRGLGLFEVIVCTALVAVMIIPIAGVIRASAKSIARADGSTSTEADLRTALRWMRDSIRDGDVITVRGRRLQIRLSSGDVATIQVRRGVLELDDGRTRMPLAQNVRDIRFTELNQVAPPRTRIGISMSLRARDPETRLWVTVNSTVAIPPQA